MDLPGDYPARYESRCELKNGRQLFIRPVKPTDGQLIISFFNRLSSRSVYMRFLRHLNYIPEEMLFRFTHLDYERNFALAAVDEQSMEIVAVARYIGSSGEDSAELAIAVRDDLHNYGLGKLLLNRLADIGAEHGICRFHGVADSENGTIRQILAELGWKPVYTLKGGLYQVEIAVERQIPG